MAIAAPVTAQPLSSLSTRPAEAGPVPLGVRGAISLGSGLRAGVVLAENVERIAAELGEARTAAADAAREAARAEAELERLEAEDQRLAADQVAADFQQPGSSANASEFRVDDEEAARQIAEAQEAGENGAATQRGTFVDFAV